MIKFLRLFAQIAILTGIIDVGLTLLNHPSTIGNWAGAALVAASIWWVVARLIQVIKERRQAYLDRQETVSDVHRTSLLLILALVAGLYGSAGCATRVNAGNVGIKINYAGTYRGVQDVPIVTGWVWYWPNVSTILEYPTYVQNVVWTHNIAEGNPVNEEITFTNADQMSIAVDVSLAYHLDAATVPGFYIKFRSDDLKTFTLGFMRNVARDEFNAHGGLYHMDQIMGDNAKFIAEVRDSLQTQVKPYGVVLDQFGIIGAPRPPQSVVDSIGLKVKAQQIALQKQIEITQAEAEANKAVATANGYARSLTIKAEADASYNRKVAESLTPNLIQSQAIKAWNGTMPTVTGGSVPFISIPTGK